MPGTVSLSGQSTLDELVRFGVRLYLPSGSERVRLPVLPPELGTFRNIGSLGVEFRLGRPDGPVDFAWAQPFPGLSIPIELRGLDPWRRVAAISQAWWAGAPELACAHSVLYELDQQGTHLASCPAIFFSHAPSPESTALAFLRATRRFLGHGEVAVQERSVSAVLRTLPPGATLVGHGDMLSRPGTPLRLMVMHVGPVQALEQSLTALDWPGDITAVTETLSKLPRSLGVCDLALALDVAEGVGPSLGVELILHGGGREPAVQIVLDELIASGLCLAEHRHTIETWTAWNPGAAPLLSAFAPATGARHRISHVKIAFGPGGIEAKGYLECLLPRARSAPADAKELRSEPG